MHKYIAKRLLLMIPVIVGISFIIFSIMSFMPGNPARLILGEKATADAIAALNEQMGLNDPFIIRILFCRLSPVRRPPLRRSCE